MKFFSKLFLSSLILLTTTAVYAVEYKAPELLARANVNDGFNLPPMTFLSDTCPVINNRGDVTFKLVAVEGQNNQGLWIKTAEDTAGKILYTAPDERLITDPSINDQGQIAFNLYDEGVTDGLFVFDAKTLKVEQVLQPDDLNIMYYTYPQIQNNGHIFFRATDDDNNRLFYEFTGTKLNSVIAEGVDSLGVKASYLFRPAVNELGEIASKVRLGEKGQWDEQSPDQILLLTPANDAAKTPAKAITIARDRDSDPTSPYLGFGNSVSLSKHGLVAFMAILEDSKKAIVISTHEGVQKIVAKEGSLDISEIELFAPKINDQGSVLFRAKDGDDKRSLFLADESGVKKIISVGDVINTDLGLGRILSNPNYPGFGGEVDMNDRGEIVFHCLVVSAEDNKEWGSAVFKITPLK